MKYGTLEFKKKVQWIRGITNSDMSAIEQHKSSEKYGGRDGSTDKELNCMRSSKHTNTCTPATNNDLESHDPSVRCKF